LKLLEVFSVRAVLTLPLQSAEDLRLQFVVENNSGDLAAFGANPLRLRLERAIDGGGMFDFPRFDEP
jgi:hypothetical protein